jgi:hypothetical protein
LEKVSLEFELEWQLGALSGLQELPLFTVSPARRGGRLGRTDRY